MSREPNARFISRAYLGSEKAEMKDHWVVLQSSIPGTCQLTVNKQVERHTIVALDLGWGDMIDRVFLGYVDRVEPSVNGWFTLFCRELSSALTNNLSVMIRQPTMRKLVDELASITGLEFVLPDKRYTDTAIPCFYSDASGIAIMDNIGRAFQIDDFIWQQQGNGKIYLGSYQDSFWADKSINIPNNLMTGHQSGRKATLPAIPKLRPNVLANGRRIQSVEFKGTNITVGW